MKHELFLKCACHSIEHQLFFSFEDDKGWNEEAYIEVHLSPIRGFWRRLWHGISAAVNPTCSFGAWEEFILYKDDTARLVEFLQSVHACQAHPSPDTPAPDPTGPPAPEAGSANSAEV